MAYTTYRAYGQSLSRTKQTYRTPAQANTDIYDQSQLPELQVFIDWDNDGTFSAGDEVTDDIYAPDGISWERGRSADFSADAVGTARFTLVNTDNTYSPATNTNLVPGRPVLIKSTDCRGYENAHFYGYIQRISPDANNYLTTVEVYDPRGAMGRMNLTLPTRHRTHREIRLDALHAFGAAWKNHADFNPDFATNTTGWTATAGSITRKTTDGPSELGLTTCVELSNSGQAIMASRLVDCSVSVGDIVHVSYWAKLTSGDANYPGGATLRNSADGEISTGIEVYYAADWEEVRQAFVITAAATGLKLLVYSNSLPGTNTLRLSGFQITKGPDAHAFSATGGTGLGGMPENLINDPSFEIGPATKYWSKDASSFTAAAVSDLSQADMTDSWPEGPSASGRYIGYGMANNVANSGWKHTGFGSRTFFANNAYTFSVWLRQQFGSYTWEIGLGSNGTSTDKATSSITVGTTWTQYSVTWTPTADRTDVLAFIRIPGGMYNSDSTAVDAAACYPGSTTYDYEPDYADLEQEDCRAPDNASSGTVKAILDSVNGVTLTRHWIQPITTAPYWQYKTEIIDSVVARGLAETFVDGDFYDFTDLDIDDEAVINVQSVEAGTKYIDTSGDSQTNADASKAWSSDGTSVDLHGRRDGTAISSALIENIYPVDLTYQQTLADNVIMLSATAHSRPKLTVVNRFPTQLLRELDDKINLTFTRLGISNQDYFIIKLATTVTNGGRLWTTEYTLEESVL